MHNILPPPVSECRRCRFFHGCIVGGFAQRADAPLIVVSPYPSAEDEKQGRPMMSPGGQMLRNALRAIKLDPDRDVSYLHALQCAPMGREIKDENIKACRYWVQPQFRQLTGKVVLLCGPESAKSLIPHVVRKDEKKDWPLAKLRGSWYEHEQRRFRVTFNPSYVDRMSAFWVDGYGNLLKDAQGRPRRRGGMGTVPAFFWDDIQAVGRELGTI